VDFSGTTKYPESCASKRHVERVSLEMPAGIAVTSIPGNVTFKKGDLTYTARYIRKGKALEVQRELVIKRKERFCPPSDEADWLDLTDVMKRDLRSQVFIQ
jgi:hypothetical protein